MELQSALNISALAVRQTGCSDFGDDQHSILLCPPSGVFVLILLLEIMRLRQLHWSSLMSKTSRCSCDCIMRYCISVDSVMEYLQPSNTRGCTLRFILASLSISWVSVKFVVECRKPHLFQIISCHGFLLVERKSICLSPRHQLVWDSVMFSHVKCLSLVFTYFTNSVIAAGKQNLVRNHYRNHDR